ncbi:hypothetical protein BGW37DRAFT_491969 [Umbelopsis sp. PMI_123]|nr:hypothetical protein BGW37DRAFT_491969 [Umbelopsis sp. PMI_123]
MNLQTYFPTYFAIRILAFVLMLLLLYPALRSSKHRTLISLYVVECLSDINSIVFLAVEASEIMATTTTTTPFVVDGLCIFTAYAWRFVSVARTVLILALCINLWMAVHKPHINSDREWFFWYIIAAFIISLLSTLPVFIWERIHEPEANAQTLFTYFRCYINDRLTASAFITYVQFAFNVISMIVIFHSTFDVIRHKFKLFRNSPSASNEIDKALQSRIVLRMLFCSIFASILVFWLDLQAIIALANNRDDNTNVTISNAGLNIFNGIVASLFYFLAFGTTMEFVNTYFYCLVPLFKRSKHTQDIYNSRRQTIGSLPRFKLSLSKDGEPEGEWRELESYLEHHEGE